MELIFFIDLKVVIYWGMSQISKGGEVKYKVK